MFMRDVSSRYCFRPTYKKNPQLTSFNVCEIGLAYGTSSMVILNEIIKSGLPSTYTVLDPNQTEQWNSVGHKNILEFKRKYDSANLVNYSLIEGYSNVEMPRLTGEYNIIFIDGSHATNIVMEDMVNAGKLLVNGGIMILDDVRHKEVQLGVEWFVKNYPQYKRISVNDKQFPTLGYENLNKVYDAYGNKKSYTNPTTMFALVKDTNYTPNQNLLHHHVSLHLHEQVLPLKEKFIQTAESILKEEDYKEMNELIQEINQMNCLHQPMSTPQVTLCLNRIIQRIRELDQYLMFDFRDVFKQHKRNPSYSIQEGRTYMNRRLSMFCILSLIYLNYVINMDILVGDPVDEKDKKLKYFMYQIIFGSIIPEITDYVKRLMSIIVYRTGYDHVKFFGYMKARTEKKPLNWEYNDTLAIVNKSRTYMKGNNPRINLLKNISPPKGKTKKLPPATRL